MPTRSAEAVVCGAGLVGVATAFHLAERSTLGQVVLIDDHEPLLGAGFWGELGYHTDVKESHEGFVAFLERSVDLLEELAQASEGSFDLDRRGWIRLTGEPGQVAQLRAAGERLERCGQGALREHAQDLAGVHGPAPKPIIAALKASSGGSDLIVGSELVRGLLPFVTHDTHALLWIRRAGWFDSASLGGWMLERARARRAELIRDRIEEVKVHRGKIEKVILHSGVAINTERLVVAAGPWLRQAVGVLGLDLPVLTEVHSCMLLRERLGIVPPETPLLVWDDSLYLRWSEREREQLAASAETRWLVEALPGGVLVRPWDAQRGGRLLVSWNYDPRVCDPRAAPIFDPFHAEILMRGLVRVVPGLFAYFGHGEEGQVEGSYAVRAPDDLPLIGPLPIEGAFVAGALGRWVGMAAAAAGELAALHVTGGELPGYASAFVPARFGTLAPGRPPAPKVRARR